MADILQTTMLFTIFTRHFIAAGEGANRRKFVMSVSTALLIAIVLFANNFSNTCFGQTIGQPRGSGEVWEISTRHLPCFPCNTSSPPNFEVFRSTQCRWEKGTLEEAIGPSPETGIVPLTIIYVHGNFMERDNARERVRIINSHLARQACEPYRLLMLSWPSQRNDRILRDVKGNAQCADSEAYYLGWLLQAVSANADRVSLLGFSFGARSVAGGLHLDAGGCIPGLPRLPANSGHAPYRVSLVAPAIDREWLDRNGRLQYAMNNVELLVNLYNSRDPILRRFRFIDSLARPIAAGFSGFEAVADPRSTTPLTGSDRIQQYDCGSQIGSTHSERDYYGECPHFRKAVNNLLWKTP